MSYELLGVEKITPEIKTILDDQLKMKEYKGRTLSSFSNPFSKTYMMTNLFLFSGCLYSKYLQHKLKLPGRFINSTAMIMIIWTTIWNRKKFDYPQGRVLQSLEEDLYLSPITRNAYHGAIEENKKYQMRLRKEIERLEKNK